MILNFGTGLFKVSGGGYNATYTNSATEDVYVTAVYVRSTGQSAYYIVYLADGRRINRISDFKVGKKSLKKVVVGELEDLGLDYIS